MPSGNRTIKSLARQIQEFEGIPYQTALKKAERRILLPFHDDPLFEGVLEEKWLEQVLTILRKLKPVKVKGNTCHWAMVFNSSEKGWDTRCQFVLTDLPSEESTGDKYFWEIVGDTVNMGFVLSPVYPGGIVRGYSELGSQFLNEDFSDFGGIQMSYYDYEGLVLWQEELIVDTNTSFKDRLEMLAEFVGKNSEMFTHIYD